MSDTLLTDRAYCRRCGGPRRIFKIREGLAERRVVEDCPCPPLSQEWP